MSKYVQIYDCEFSGPKVGKGDILSIACIIADTKTLNIVDKFTEYARPRDFSYWNSYAEKIHGISKAEARTFQSQKELGIKMLHRLKPYKCPEDTPMPFVMHNSAGTDFTFIAHLYEHLGLDSSFQKIANVHQTIKTNFVFREYLRRKNKSDNKTSLSVMAEEFGLALNHHEVESDTMACYEGLVELVKFFKPKGGIHGARGTICYRSFNQLVKLYEGEDARTWMEELEPASENTL